jgi:hypothetical protein
MADPLEQLKQQLYAKIQATSEPEQPLFEANLLKPSQLPTYQAHQRLRQQTEQQWKKEPIQGAIPSQSPFTSADEAYLLEVLTECRVKLKSALGTAQRYPQLADLTTAISDAITGCNEGLTVINDPTTYME